MDTQVYKKGIVTIDLPVVGILSFLSHAVLLGPGPLEAMPLSAVIVSPPHALPVFLLEDGRCVRKQVPNDF